MTHLDVAHLHSWLTEQQRLADLAIDAAHEAGRHDEALAAAEAGHAYGNAIGWLRIAAADQQPLGHDVDPERAIALGQVIVATDIFWGWLNRAAASSPSETQAKTYAAVAAELGAYIRLPERPAERPRRRPRYWWVGALTRARRRIGWRA